VLFQPKMSEGPPEPLLMQTVVTLFMQKQNREPGSRVQPKSWLKLRARTTALHHPDAVQGQGRAFVKRMIRRARLPSAEKTSNGFQSELAFYTAAVGFVGM